MKKKIMIIKTNKELVKKTNGKKLAEHLQEDLL